ncbi:hypothetical protein QUH73_04340 [Labilibaculum sp. K2S]|uniref:hypothetical protein n=1 Tax=Labilibaculum sp. K2S TaxID=3056386 RepID=UPI0025A47412|nr:hypothetical protein [Labilibaculum sp. K2S]MDM8159044.1 hypothetical protein [Labilibaculum sp. K2S]
MAVVGTELLKTVGGVMVGRYAVVMGKKALKVDQEADPKKKKIKEIGIGLGVTAVGAFGAIKAPNQYKSICAGIATAGALSAMTPFAKEEGGFIPALHGGIGMAELDNYNEDDMSIELNSAEDMLDEEDRDELNALEALEGNYEDASYEELSEVN